MSWWSCWRWYRWRLCRRWRGRSRWRWRHCWVQRSHLYIRALAVHLIGRFPSVPSPVEKAVVRHITAGKPCKERGWSLPLPQEAPPVPLPQTVAGRINVHIQRIGSKTCFDFIELGSRRLVARRKEPVVHRGIGTHAKLMPTTVWRIPRKFYVDYAPFRVGMRGFQSIISPIMLGRL